MTTTLSQQRTPPLTSMAIYAPPATEGYTDEDRKKLYNLIVATHKIVNILAPQFKQETSMLGYKRTQKNLRL